MTKKINLILILCTVLIGCSYEFSSDNYIELQEPNTNNSYIELLDFKNLDTINIQTSLTYRFNGTSGQNTITSEVFVNNDRINSNLDGQLGTFTLRPENYEDGTYSLRIEHTFSSGTGSIADQAGLEVLKETTTYQFVVNREPSQPPSMLSADIIDGTIFVEWSQDYEKDYTNAYLSLKFKTEEVRIPLSQEELGLGIYNDRSTVLYQGDSNTPDFDEYSSVTYSIYFESDYENNYGLSQTIIYDPGMVTTELVFVDFTSYKFKWSAHPLYANFETFEFSYLEGTFVGSSQGGEYLIETPYIFGQKYRLNARPANTGLLLPYYSYRDVSLDPETFGEFQLEFLFVKDILYNPSTDHYYALIIENRSGFEYYFSIYEYSNEMVFLRKSNPITYDNQRYEYLGMELNPLDNSIHLDARGSAYKMDATSLEIIEEYKDPTLTSQLLFRGEVLARLEYSTDQLTVLDTASNATLYSTISPASQLGYISPDGRYIFIYEETGNFLYRIEEDELVLIMDFSLINFNGNMQIFEDTLFYAGSNEIVIVDLMNNSTKSFSFGSTQQFLQFDSFSQKLLISQNGQNAIYDVLTEEITTFQSEDDKQASGTFFSEDRDYFMRLLNGRLIHSKGIFIGID